MAEEIGRGFHSCAKAATRTRGNPSCPPEFLSPRYAARGLSSLVVEAFAITSIIFVSLTLFTIQSKIDFSFLGAGLFVALFGLMVWSFFAMYIFPSFVFRQARAPAGSAPL